MKNTLLALALSAAALALPVASHAADAGGFFVNGGAGQSDVDKGVYKDNESAFYGNIGYRWALSPAAAVGIEGGYTSQGTFAPKGGYEGLPNGKASGWTLGANGHFNITPEWYLSGRVGGYFADLKGEYIPGGLSVNPLATNAVYVSGNSTDYYAGAGFGYDFSNNFSVGVNYDYYKASKSGLTLDPYIISVSGEFRFQ
jgi:opacity protein-like surface antigen